MKWVKFIVTISYIAVSVNEIYDLLLFIVTPFDLFLALLLLISDGGQPPAHEMF